MAMQGKDLSRSNIDFVPGKTLLTHDVYGHGTYTRFVAEGLTLYLCVKFDNWPEEMRFPWMDGLPAGLSARKPEESRFSKEIKPLSDSQMEERHFTKVSAIAQATYEHAYASRNAASENGWRYLSADEAGFQKTTPFFSTELSRNVRLWAGICLEPFFARVDYRGNEQLYIGKHEIPGEVIDWADRRCSVYYNYQMYIGNREFGLSLVRNFDIRDGKYFGFTDAYVLYSKSNVKKDHTREKEVITDEHLLAVIESYKGSKEVHDIIASIQGNQYQIITQDKEKPLSVCGCAGCGKTMIMYHRLRYLLFNNRDMEIGRTYLISPTDILNAVSDELSKTLQIDRANRFSAARFYRHIAECYAKLLEIPCRAEHTASGPELPEETIQRLYTTGCYKFSGQIRDLFDGKHPGRTEEFIAGEVRALQRKLRAIGCQAGGTLDSLLPAGDVFAKNLKYYQKATGELQRYSMENAREMWKDYVEKKARKKENEKKDLRKEKGKKKGKKNGKKNGKDKEFLKYLIDHQLFKSKITKRTTKGYILYGLNISGLQCLLDQESPFWKDEKMKGQYACGGRFKDPLELMAAYQKLRDQVQRLRSFAENHSPVYLFDAVRSIARDLKAEYRIPADACDTWEVFYACLAAEQICGPLDHERRYVFIDEFQDFSPEELRCVSRIFPKAVFNLFGDLNQCITPKGIRKIEQLPFKTRQYTLRENYRNALEITEHANQVFGMDMLPIGIHGTVVNASRMPAAAGLAANGDRAAVICKSFDALPRIGIHPENSPDFVFGAENSQIEPNKINIFTVSQVKGLEFEKVFVVTDEMTQNELYVSMTRALNELVIIS